MATTTNYSWTTPDDTALVKDGAAAIRSLGTAIDSTVFTNAGAAVTKATVDAKGDLIAGTADNTVARLAVGANGTVLTADSVEATGLKWTSIPSSGDSWTLLNSGGTALTGSSTVTVSGISGKEKLFILVEGASSSAQSTISVRVNGLTTNVYVPFGTFHQALSTYTVDNIIRTTNADGAAMNQLVLGQMSTNTSSTVSGYCLITGCSSATNIKMFQSSGAGTSSTGNNQSAQVLGGYINTTSAITSVSITCPGGGNLDAGTVYVYANS
jgi:hypothetical protein